ncbi:MAG: DNA-binding protein [Candidatus Aenigmarchaeota archaeon]|nr:DNA-binding protein [Candidatus Aenigmarchaeota archaeon]
MKIAELNASASKVSINATVTQKGETRDVNTKYGATRVCETTVEDESGSITLVLWGDDCDKVKEGDRIKIENGYIREWNGVPQLNVGKFGKMEVL